MSAAPVLTIMRNGETIRSHSLEGEAVLGRGEDCVIRIEDRAVSRQHAILKPTADGIHIEKKSEFAPMLVNGAECTRAVVKEGDVIAIGPYLMRIKMGTSLPSVPMAPVAPAAPPPPLPTDEVMLSPIELSVEAPPNEAPGETGTPLEAVPIEAAPIEDAPMDLNLQLDQPAVESSSPAEIAVPDAAPSDFAASPDERTQAATSGDLEVRLIIAEGAANVTEFEVKKPEVYIGRGKNCDIILDDKKASRRNSVIRRAGLHFVIKDLESSNGTYVNGVKVQEQELSGEDVIRIGDVEIRFKAVSAGYQSQEKDFIAVPEEPEAPPQNEAVFSPVPDAPVPLENPNIVGGISGITGINVPGVSGLPNQKKSLLQKFRDLPPRKRMIYIIAMGALAWMLLDETPEEQPKAKAQTQKVDPKASPGVKAVLTFESLTPEQKQFVEAQHALAFELYRNKDYDKALFEVRKIFQLIPDYKDSREIERYAQEGKRKLEAIEDEKRKKEDEAKLKARVAEILDEITQKMDAKKYAEAKELFPEVLTIDPDNLRVADWKRQIEAIEDQQRLEGESKRVQEQINQKAWELYNEGLALKKKGKYHSAISSFSKVADVGASDPKVNKKAGAQIKACHHLIKSRRDPVLADAKAAEESGEFKKAFSLYRRATQIDPPHQAGYAGMNRIRGVLHERAKTLYTEAVLAESYSDFPTAKRKFQETMDMAPEDDVYHGRAQRKLARYFKSEDIGGAQ